MNGTGVDFPDVVYHIHRTALAIDVLSFSCSLMIILTLLIFKNLRKRRIWIMIVGVSVGDMSFSFHHGLDHILSLSNMQGWPADGHLCRWLAAGTTAGFWIASSWVLVIAGSMLYTFTGDLLEGPREIPMRSLLIFTFILSNASWIIGLSGGWFGLYAPSQPTWCFWKDPYYSLVFNDAWVIVFSLLLLLIYLFLALKFLRLKSTSKLLALKSLKRIMFFPLIYSIQWFPYVVMQFTILSGQVPSLSLALTVIVTINSGGILNAIVYYGFLVLASRFKWAVSTRTTTIPKVHTTTEDGTEKVLP